MGSRIKPFQIEKYPCPGSRMELCSIKKFQQRVDLLRSLEKYQKVVETVLSLDIPKVSPTKLWSTEKYQKGVKRNNWEIPKESRMKLRLLEKYQKVVEWNCVQLRHV